MMRQLLGKRLSTALFDVEQFATLIRVSTWADPAELEIHPDDDGESPTVRVKYQRGRQTLYGSVDREALVECSARAKHAAQSATGA